MLRHAVIVALLGLAAVPLCAGPAQLVVDDFEGRHEWRIAGEARPGASLERVSVGGHAGKHALALTATLDPGAGPLRIERRLAEPANWTPYHTLRFSIRVEARRVPPRVGVFEVRGRWDGTATVHLADLKPGRWVTLRVPVMGMWDRGEIERFALELRPEGWQPGERVRVLLDNLRAEAGEPYESIGKAARAPAPARVAAFGGCTAYAEDALNKVYADAPYPPRGVRDGGAVEIAAARNEYEPAQLVFRSGAALSDLRVVPTELRGAGGSIAAEHVRCQRVGYVAIDTPSDEGGRIGLCPDILYNDDRFSVAAGRNQAVWITVYVPKGTPPGRYAGHLQVEQGGRAVARIPLRVRVFGFTIPDRVHCRTVFSLYQPQCEAYHGKWTFELARAYYRNMAEHRASPMGFWFVPDPHELDFSEYDRHLALFKEMGFNTYCLTEPWLAPHVRPWKPAELPALRLETGAGPDDMIVFHRGALAADPGQRWRWADGWHHAALTWDAKTLSLLLDGRVVASQPEERPFTPYAGGRWHLGARAGQAEQMFRGWIDDFRLSDVARDAESIRASLGDPLAVDAHTLALVSFEGAEGLTAPDAARPGRVATAVQPVAFEEGPFGRCAHLSRAEVLSLPADPALDPAHLPAFTVEIRFRRDGDPVAWSNPWSYSGDAPGTPEQNRRFLSGMLDHAAQEGVLDDTYLYVIDEPNFTGKLATMARYSRELAELDPRVARHKMRLVTCMPDPQYHGLIDIWCPVLQQWFPEQARERQAAGDHVWWYVCCGPGYPYPNFLTDHPGIEPRVLFWMQYRFNVEGFLYWALNWWGLPQNDPFRKHLRIASGTGDGLLLYPGPDGPLNSVRWECIRDGIEDYEYHWLLKDAIGSRRAKPGRDVRRVAAAERALRQADSFLATHRDVSYLNPGHIRQGRLKLAQAIEALGAGQPSGLNSTR